MASSWSSASRARTSSETLSISSSSRATPTRTTVAGWAPMGSAARRSMPLRSMTPASRPIASSAAISASSLPLGSLPSAPRAASCVWMASKAARMVEMKRLSGTVAPSRALASGPSAAWTSRPRRGRSRKPQVPLMVWTTRNTRSSRARSPGVFSHRTRSVPMLSRFSADSDRKSTSNSSMGPEPRLETTVPG